MTTSRPTIPTAPGAVPVLGHVVTMLRNPLQFLGTLPEHGDLVRLRLGPVDVVVVCDPGLTQQVLRDDRTFDKGGVLDNRARELLGDGIATCPHSRHRKSRRLMQPSFHSSRLPEYANVMTERVAGFTDTWCDGQDLDVLPEMMLLTAGITMETMFGAVLPAAQLRRALDDLEQLVVGIYLRTVIPGFPKLPLPINRRYNRARAHLRQVFSEIVAVRRSEEHPGSDLLSMLSSLDGENAMSDTELTDQALIFFLAGSETAASVLAWALHVIAADRRLEERIHDEVDRIPGGRPARFEDLPNLRLVSSVVTETLRLYPPVWITTRTTAEDTKLGGKAVPAGTTIVYSPYIIHRRPELYEDPELFTPDRWGTSGELPPHGEGFTAFGGGARKCIGDQFGMIEATLALAIITARWRLTEIQGRNVRPSLGLAFTPRDLHMRVFARQPRSASSAGPTTRER
ncbi:cytochrome P450 [Nocardia iowensis]|uniref:Cytochrome P450 n=1 Tax=Nocardia iowensis TaxID=204891 RepID=A0ABX8S0L3_NOCIO|nr:cytochrome P450 [Nocardia iowensis]QXN94624.1 cytochrome P450 [Nocardia iowensis]